jgi:cation diffusion facilitator family transporter
MLPNVVSGNRNLVLKDTFVAAMDGIHGARRAARLSLVVNVILAAAKATAGILGHSQALMADAIESVADVFSSTIVALGIRYASRPADKNHPYGHGRAEPLVTFLVAGFLVFSVVIIARDSVINITRPHEMPAGWTLAVLAVIIATKETFYQVIMRRARHLHSTTLRAEAWHHRSDALTSVTAFAGIAIAMWLGKGYEAADDWAALVACAIILVNAYRLFRPALGEIMDEDVHDELVSRIRELSKEVEGVIDTEKCHVRKSGMMYHVDLHIVVDGDMTVRSGHDIAHKLKNHLRSAIPQLADVLIHVEPDADIVNIMQN